MIGKFSLEYRFKTSLSTARVGLYYWRNFQITDFPYLTLDGIEKAGAPKCK
jgi:hypothetical protein